ncbi:QcrA and Rieske domain-containing protein [Tautonia plasticadhaerens]|nr:Rieske (2Fe-2S) protein [Tautonia plasticadhaerens]
MSVKEKLAAARARTSEAEGAAESRQTPGPTGEPGAPPDPGASSLPARSNPTLELADRLRASAVTRAVADPVRAAPFRSGEGRGQGGFSEFIPAVGVWGALAVVGGAIAATFAVLALTEGAEEPTGEVIVGPPDGIEAGVVSEAFVDVGGFWLVRSPAFDGIDSIVALRAACPIRECDVVWDPGGGRFECPCDGSTFTIAGLVSGGPSPRALERCRISKGEDGLIRVDPGRTYREERGQWADPESVVLP